MVLKFMLMVNQVEQIHQLLLPPTEELSACCSHNPTQVSPWKPEVPVIGLWPCGEGGWDTMGGNSGPTYLDHVIHDVYVKAFAVTTGAPDPPQVL